MEVAARIVPFNRHGSPLLGIDRVVDTLGSSEFEGSFSALMNDTCGADFCSVFRIDDSGRASVVASTTLIGGKMASDHAHRYISGMHWRHDPALAEAVDDGGKGAMLVQIDPSRIDDIVLKREFYGPASISDRLAINARREGSLFVVSLLRTLQHGVYSNEQIERVAALADTIIALVARHAALKSAESTNNILSSVPMIEERLKRVDESDHPWGLTNRERQVCARILYGMAAVGIAIDLGVSECSVDTYRKRAYHRLGIATRHELLRLFLALKGSELNIH